MVIGSLFGAAATFRPCQALTRQPGGDVSVRFYRRIQRLFEPKETKETKGCRLGHWIALWVSGDVSSVPGLTRQPGGDVSVTLLQKKTKTF